MSSTTERPRERGQILVLFAGGIGAIMILAALAFDAGMMLVERRTQQNAADAAALAAARYVLASPAYGAPVHCASAPADAAILAACALALQNGFDDASDEEVVTVSIPPRHGIYAGLPGFVEVQVESVRASIFAGIIGRASWPVGVMAVAGNQQDLTFGFGMLALHPTACKAMQISGQGVVYSRANLHSNSSGADCADGSGVGFSRTGGGTIDIDAPDAVCRSAGAIEDRGSGSMNCTPDPHSFSLPDPLRTLPAPTKPPLAEPMLPRGHSLDPPRHCPGHPDPARAPSETNPQTCVIGLGSQQANRAWVLHPGLYPGGIDVRGGSSVYLLPGIYWIGGGGFKVAGDATIMSVATETDTTVGGGVLLYNSSLPTGGAGNAGAISLGGSGATLLLRPLDMPDEHPDEIFDNIVIFQARDVTLTVSLNGSSSGGEVRGIIYVPSGQLKLNGNGGTLTVDQAIASTYLIDGNGGTINVLREVGVDAEISGVGLVE